MSNVEKKLVQDIIEWRAEKKKDNTTKEALNEDFYLSDTSEGYAVGVSTCQSLGAQLATIRSEEEDTFVSSLVGSSEEVRIGLIRTDWTTGNWEWLDTLEPSPYRNWLGETPDITKSCIIKSNPNLEKWKMVGCESTPAAAGQQWSLVTQARLLLSSYEGGPVLSLRTTTIFKMKPLTFLS